jgi:hypothetical protein
MPGLNRVANGDAIDFAEFIARLEEGGAQLDTPDAVERQAGLLGRLNANRDFLVDAAISALKERCGTQSATNGYGAQVMLLHRREGKFFVRANFWPSFDDPVARASGRSHYSYDVPHDHNFDFLTVGYLGPGYRSDWFEYEHERVAGYVGESVDLRLTERGQLTPGRLLHYRAHVDIHHQLPPESPSVSINIVPEHPGLLWRDQYVLDLDRSCIAAIQTVVPAETLLKLAVHFGEGNGHDLVHDFARRHSSHRVRWTAWRALAGQSGDADAQRACYEAAARSESALVAGQARTMLERLGTPSGAETA